jgi:hypothetical protein
LTHSGHSTVGPGGSVTGQPPSLHRVSATGLESATVARQARNKTVNNIKTKLKLSHVCSILNKLIGSLEYFQNQDQNIFRE